MKTTEERNTDHCPHGAHTDHENRIKRCEDDITDLKEADEAMKAKMGNPAVVVALISFLGICVTASASFAAVIAAPLIQGVLKSWGWM